MMDLDYLEDYPSRLERSKYYRAVKEFDESGEKAAHIDAEPRRLRTIYVGLRRVADMFAGVSVHMIAGKIYLEKRGNA